MAPASAAHFASLRRLSFAREVQQIAFSFVKYGSAAYFFRTYVMGVTAVSNSHSMLPVAARILSHKWPPNKLLCCNSAPDQACFLP